MPITVQLPNNTEVEFPDGMDEQSIRSAIAKSFPELMPREPGLIERVSNTISSGIARVGEAMAKQELPKAGVPAVTVPRFGEPGTITRGVSEGLSAVVEGATTPEGIALGGLMPAVPGASKVIGPLFIGAGFKATGEAAGEYAATGDKEKLGEAITLGALSAAGGLLEARGAVKEMRAAAKVIDESIKPVAPASAEALKETVKAIEPENKPAPVAPEQAQPAVAPTTAAASEAKASGVTAPEAPSAISEATTVIEGNQQFPTGPGPKLRGFEYHPSGFVNDIPVFSHPDAKVELARLFGIPNLDSPIGQKPMLLFIDETQGGRPVAYFTSEKPTTPVEVKQIAKPEEVVGMGGATPAEFVPEPLTTGIKNAEVDKARVERGLEPIMRPSRLSNQLVWDRVMQKIDADPGWQDRLIKELRENPRTPSQDEVLALDHRYVDLQNEYTKASKAAVQAFDDGRMEDLALAKERVADWESKLTELEQVSHLIGTEWGRSGQMRQRLMREDFTLEAMERKKREAKGFEQLTDAERMEVKRLHDEMQEKIKQLEERVNERDQKIAELEAQKTIVEIKETAKREPRKPGATNDRDAVISKIKEKADAGKPTEITGLIQKLVRMFVEDGVTERNALIDAVHGVVKDIIPDMTRRDTMDAISGYGKYKQLSKDEISVIVRDLKGQMQQVAKLEDMAAGEAPKKTGVERRTPSDEERRLIKQVNEKKKEGGFDVTDPEKQLKTALQAIKTRLENQIKDLEHQLNTRKKIVKENRSIQYDAEAEALRVRRDELKAQYDEMFPKEPISEAERLQRWKTRTQKRIAELEQRVADGDFSVKKKTPMVMDQEAINIEFKLDEIRKKWYEGLINDRLSKRNIAQKVIGTSGEYLNTIRAVLTSADLSAVLRQGGFIAFGHPIRSAKSIPAMLRSFASKEAQFKVDQDIRTRTNYPLYKQAGLELTEHGATSLVKMEEAYMSRLAENIPIVSGSQRAYVTFLNKLRADSFDAMVKSLSRDGKNVTREEAAIIANFINVATGRGKIGVNDRMAVGMNTVFFAPKFVASRFQLLLGQPLYHGVLSGKVPFAETARARKAVANEYARFLVGASIVYALGKLAGGEIEPDPRSSDFGKIRFGDTRIDPMGGLIQSSVLLGRIATGETKTGSGKVIPIRGDIPYGGSNAADVMGRFLRTKLSPVFGAAVDVASGENVIGEKVTPELLAKRMLVPISMQDIYDTMIEQGVPAGTALTVLSVFGMGVQTYDQRKQ